MRMILVKTLGVRLEENNFKRKDRYLKGCYLVTTLEPCPMCTSVAIWAKMKGIIFGASQNDAIEYSNTHPESKLSWRQITVPASYIIEHGTPRKIYWR